MIAATVVSLAGTAHAQTAPVLTTPPGRDLTRDLNSGPPVPAAYIAPEPAPVVVPAPVPARAMTPEPTTTAPPSPAPIVRATPPPTPAPNAPSSAPVVVPPVPAPAVRTQPPAPRPAPVEPAPVEPAPAARPAPAPAPAPDAPPPNIATVTVLDAATRAALPFSITLPAGFEIVTGRPGPDFRIYTVRRGDQSFVMVYAGPASQFPIFSGQMVEAGGRASIVSTEDGVRHALEHLFQRPDAPREVHAWTMSLEGPDRALAERIAQSIDIR